MAVPGPYFLALPSRLWLTFFSSAPLPLREAHDQSRDCVEKGHAVWADQVPTAGVSRLGQQVPGLGGECWSGQVGASGRTVLVGEGVLSM